jgi:hypothetical protein
MARILTKKLYLRLIDLMKTPSDIIFIDETGFNNHMVPKNGWKFKGTGPIGIESMSKSGNVTLIMAVSFYHGIIAYQASDRHVNQATFLEFLKKVK